MSITNTPHLNFRGDARRAGGLTHDESFFLLLNDDTAEEISVLWDKLAAGATVMAPLLASQSAAPPYGMLTDRFALPGSSASPPPTDRPGGGRRLRQGDPAPGRAA